MDIKKSPKANLENKKMTYILIGLVAAFSVLYVCFEWTEKEITIYDIEDTSALDFEDEVVIQTVQDETPPPPPPPEPEVIETINIVDDDTETEDVDFVSEDTEDQAQEIIEAPIEEEEEEEIEQVFVVVEQMPEPPGGMRGLMKYFGKHVRYPIVAQENNIQGRVICQFTVFKDGHIGDIKVVRGVHPSLDKEAIRLLSTMPKWKPGKQQGKAVNCKFTVPVVFKLQ